MRNKILVGLVSAFTLALCAGIAFGCSKPQIPPDPGQDDVSVTLSQTELTMVIGEERSIYATVENSDEAVVWSSTNPDVATVESGKITALNDGEAVIVGTVGEAHGSCHLVVSSTESIVLNRARVRLFKGDTVQLDAQLKLGLLPSDGAVSWKSENEAVATVSDGLVTAAKVGETTITATSVSGKTASCVVKVEDVVVIALSKNEVTLHPNSTASADITVSGKKGDYNLTASSINWQSSNENIATVSATGNGARITAKKSGNAVITATVAGSSEVAVCLVDSWYALSKPSDLEYMRSDKTGIFKLVNDIDFNYSFWDGVTRWIGDGVPDDYYFGGLLDGQGYSIRNINIYAGWNNAIIGQTNSNSVVRNLSVVNLIHQDTSFKVGSVVSFNKGLIENCYVECTIASDSQSIYNSHGGLVATNAENGVIRNCIVKVNASRTFAYAGALVGYNCGQIVNSYALCTDAVLPLYVEFGVNLGSIENCNVYTDARSLIEGAELYKYSKNVWTITGKDLPVLYHYPEVNFLNPVTYFALGGKYRIAPANVIGIGIEWNIGENNGVLSVQKNDDHTLTVIARKRGSVELTARLSNGRFAKTTVVVTRTVLSPNTEEIALDYNNPALTGSSRLTFTDQNGNPVSSGLRYTSSNTGVVTVEADGSVHATGTGTAFISITYENDTYENFIRVNVTGWKQISTPEQLQAMKNDWKSNYCLVNDIDFGGKQFETITPYRDSDDMSLFFNGIFDGNGYTVRNVKIVGSDAGIWGKTADSSIIRNTIFEGIEFTANGATANTFGVVSCNLGIIRDCVVHARTTVGNAVDYRTGGALCGTNEFRGRIYNCIAYMDASAVTDNDLYTATIMGLCQGVAKDCIGIKVGSTGSRMNAISFINSDGVVACKQYASEEEAVADCKPFGSFDPAVWEISTNALPKLKKSVK